MSKKLNYSKWDALELSDDSDIETHPNVDKKSMIRWKQRDIHEKRAMRKQKLEHLAREKEMNASLIRRIDSLLATVTADGKQGIERTVSELRSKVPNYDHGLKENEQPTEDWMILSLLLQVVKQLPQGFTDAQLEKEINVHKQRVEQRQQDAEKERVQLENEGKGKITSEDVHIGFDSKTRISKTTSTASSTKGKETVIETINSPASSGSKQSANDDDDDEPDPELTTSARRFSQIKRSDFAAMFAAISDDPASLLTEQSTDALLVEAFNVILENGAKGEAQARNCVEKGLAIQYCRQLGKDGVALFFRRMAGGDPKALKVFQDDVKATGDRIVKRALEIQAERQSEQHQKEAIQLVAQNEGTSISFEVPTGPPPETIELTGEGADELDPDEVRAFLARRWEIFDAFPLDLRTALESESLGAVNKVLGDMDVHDAERVVQQLQEANILSFSEPGVRDMTSAT